jgi:hypothetical protein
MTTISSHLVRLREAVGGLDKRGARAQLSEQTLELTKGLLFFRAVGRGKQKETHGVFVKRTAKGWCNPAGVHLLQGTLAEDTFGETDLLVLVLDAETVKVLEAFGQVGFDAGGASGHTMMPGVVRGNAPPSSQVSPERISRQQGCYAPYSDQPISLFIAGLLTCSPQTCNSTPPIRPNPNRNKTGEPQLLDHRR